MTIWINALFRMTLWSITLGRIRAWDIILCRMPFSIIIHSKLKFTAVTKRRMTFCKMTLRRMIISTMTATEQGIKWDNCYIPAKSQHYFCHFTKCHSAECHSTKECVCLKVMKDLFTHLHCKSFFSCNLPFQVITLAFQ